MGLLPRPGGQTRSRTRRRSRSPRVAAIRAAEGRPWRSASAALRSACAPRTAMTSVPPARLDKLVFERIIGGITQSNDPLGRMFSTQLAPRRENGDPRAAVGGVQCLIPGPSTTLLAVIGAAVPPPAAATAFPAAMTPDCPMAPWVHHANVLPIINII